ncbi:MAG: FAS1-like dehydratase domain-containing protein [Bacillota bacterium]
MSALDKKGLEFAKFSMLVERGKIKELANAIGDQNPIYVDTGAAKMAGYKNVTIPPTFMQVLDMWSGVHDFDSKCKKLEMNPLKVLHGEQEYEYLGDIYPGDLISGVTRVIDVLVRTGSSGGMNIFKLETRYTNQQGQLVMISRASIIERH